MNNYNCTLELQNISNLNWTINLYQEQMIYYGTSNIMLEIRMQGAVIVSVTLNLHFLNKILINHSKRNFISKLHISVINKNLI